MGLKPAVEGRPSPSAASSLCLALWQPEEISWTQNLLPAAFGETVGPAPSPQLASHPSPPGSRW